jgi:tyrosinase
MGAIIEFAGTSASDTIFLTWSPRQASVRLSAGAAVSPLDVEVVSAGVAGLLFDAVRSDRGKYTLSLSLPPDGSPVKFWVAGKFGSPGVNRDDTTINVVEVHTGKTIGTRAATVRIRKDAETLSSPERDRFLNALGSLNAKGHGPYAVLREMHTAASDLQMHGNSGFLPWHRAYVLEFERALQNIDPMVTVPYWRFDKPAPNVFSADFMGAPSGTRLVTLRPGHPLEGWVTDGQSGISRFWHFPVTSAAPVLSEAHTLALGGLANSFSGFRMMELVSRVRSSSLYRLGGL